MPSVMQTTILFKASGKPNNKPIVILRGINLGRQSETNHFRTAAQMISRPLSMAWNWAWCNCTPRRIVRALFGEKVSMVVGAALVIAIWWHIISIENVTEAQEAAGMDCLYAMPWGIVWACRQTARVRKHYRKV